jgi:hypothetical protein
MLDVVDAIEIVIELCDYVGDVAELLTDGSLPDSTYQGPLKIFPVYGGRFTEPHQNVDSDPIGNPEEHT